MENIIVTAYFDIGRNDFKAIPRENNQYINYFRFWASIKNRMIIYTQSCFKDQIMQIRKEVGLEGKTEIIVVDDIGKIYPSLLEQMKKVSENHYFTDIRILENATSNIANYSYLMLLKSWFLFDASKRVPKDSLISWVDFGFNHGNDLYLNSSEFEFLWEPKVDKNKVTVFALKPYDGKPIFEIVRTLEDYMIGTVILLPPALAESLNSLYLESMSNLLSVGLIDDDQLILLMSVLKDPNKFNVIYCGWNEQFLKTTDRHFDTRDISSPNFLHKISIWYHKHKRAKRIIKRSNKLNKTNLKRILL